MTYAVGDRVKARSPDDDLWYPGRITDDNHDGTWVVKWDQPDGGPETNSLGHENLKKLIIFNGYKVGDDCRAISPDDLNWYPGSVVEVLGNNLFKVKWDDPEGGDETADVDAEFMKKVVVFKGYKPRDRVLAKYPDDGNMYEATVMRESDEGAFWVKWDDPEGGPEESLVNPKEMKYPPVPFDKLEVGQKYTGTVTRIKDFGAFVDIGSEGQGLLHISRIAVEHVKSVYDYLEEGQEVEVWICGLRPNEKKYGLTMVEGNYDRGQRQERRDLSPFLDVPPGRWLEGEVQGIRSYGCFVTVWLDNGVTGRGLVNLKDMGPGFIERVPDDIMVGQAVQVQIVSIDVEASRMSLRLQPPETSHAITTASTCAAFKGIGSSTWLTGRVERILKGYGAILAVQAPGSDQTARGLVHVTQIREGFVDRVEDELEVGDEVKVRVIKVDTVADRMELSMKLDGSESLEARLSAFKELDPSTWLTGRVTKIVDGGAFVRVQEPTQANGFVQVSQISENFVDRVEDELSVGQQVKVRVIRVEPADGQLDFSLKPASVSA